MRCYTHHAWSFPLPPGHRFPLAKYRLLAQAVAETGLAAPADSPPAAWEQLALVHDPGWLIRVRDGDLSLREERVLGLPWSPQLVERGRRSVGGTIVAAAAALDEGIAVTLGGGTHHAGRDSARGFCLFNDVAVALAVLRARRPGLRALVVDCDVHQGDGTAELLGPDSEAFALSIHCAVNYPFHRAQSDLDIDLPKGTGDKRYLASVRDALAEALVRFPSPGLAFYLAGADPWEGDALGRLALTREGLRSRDRLVLGTLRAAGIPTCVMMAGGYAPDPADTAAIHLATVEESAALMRG